MWYALGHRTDASDIDYEPYNCGRRLPVLGPVVGVQDRRRREYPQFFQAELAAHLKIIEFRHPCDAEEFLEEVASAR